MSCTLTHHTGSLLSRLLQSSANGNLLVQGGPQHLLHVIDSVTVYGDERFEARTYLAPSTSVRIYGDFIQIYRTTQQC